MSYLNGPRLNFWGGAKTNVDTANNEQYAEDNSGKPLIDLLNTKVNSNKTDDELIEIFRQPQVNQKGEPYFSVGGWNYYGDHQVAFDNAVISSAAQFKSTRDTSSLNNLGIYILGSIDPVSGEGPYASPVMVDLDPTSSSTTQIYIGGLLIGDPNNPKLLIRENVCASSRDMFLRYDFSTPTPYLTPRSAYASASFQVGFSLSSIVHADTSDPLIAELIRNNPKGLLLRFNFFQFFPLHDTKTLQESYAANTNIANPSVGHLMGSLGRWEEDELSTDLNHRQLVVTNSDGEPTAAAYIAVNEQENTLHVDLISALKGVAIRQSGNAYIQTPEANIDYGTLDICAGTKKVASITPDPDHYYLTGSIYDVSIDPLDIQIIKDLPLSIRSQQPLNLNSPEIAFRENIFRVLSDSRNIYIDSDQSSQCIPLSFRQFGRPLQNNIMLSFTTTKSGTLPDGGYIHPINSVAVKAGTKALNIPLIINGLNGFSQLNTYINGSKISANYINFRKYPEPDYSEIIASGSIPWSFVYEECLRFYYVIFPAMSKRIPLNDESTIRAVGEELLKRLSDQYRPTTLYMPLTRSMSPAKVKLLEAFLHQ